MQVSQSTVNPRSVHNYFFNYFFNNFYSSVLLCEQVEEIESVKKWDWYPRIYTYLVTWVCIKRCIVCTEGAAKMPIFSSPPSCPPLLPLLTFLQGTATESAPAVAAAAAGHAFRSPLARAKAPGNIYPCTLAVSTLYSITYTPIEKNINYSSLSPF